MNQDLLTKILDADISRDIKEKILLYWLLPQAEQTNITPIQKSEGKSGAVRRPTKEQLNLRDNPRIKEEKEAMEETLGEVVGGDE